MKKILLGSLMMASLATGSLALADSGGTLSPGGFGANEGYTQGVGLKGTGKNEENALLTTIKTFINIALSFLSFIVLILLLWGGFQMVTAAGDDGKYKKGFVILRQAAIGLIFIAVSWIVVTFLFNLANSGTKSTATIMYGVNVSN